MLYMYMYMYMYVYMYNMNAQLSGVAAGFHSSLK